MAVRRSRIARRGRTAKPARERARCHGTIARRAMSRRSFLGLTGARLAVVAAAGLFGCSATRGRRSRPAPAPPPQAPPLRRMASTASSATPSRRASSSQSAGQAVPRARHPHCEAVAKPPGTSPSAVRCGLSAAGGNAPWPSPEQGRRAVRRRLADNPAGSTESYWEPMVGQCEL